MCRISTLVLILVCSHATLLIAQRLELVLPVGHTTSVTRAEFSGDGRHLLTIAKDDPIARIWDVTSGRLQHTLEGSTTIRSACYSPDGESILIGSGKDMMMWDKSGKLLSTFSAHSGIINQVAFSPNGKFAASAGNDNLTILWDVGTGQPLAKLKGNVKACAFSSDSRRLVAAGTLSTYVWDTGTFDSLTVIRYDYVPLAGISLSPDGSSLVTWGEGMDKRAHIWDLGSGQLRYTISGTKWGFEQVLFSSDAAFLVAAGGVLDKKIRVFSSANGKELGSFDEYVSGLQPYPDKPWVLVAGAYNRLTVLDLKSIKPLREISIGPNRVTSFAVNKQMTKAVALNDAYGSIIDLAGESEAIRISGSTEFINEMDTRGDLIAIGVSSYTKLFRLSDGALLACAKKSTACLDVSPTEDKIVTTKGGYGYGFSIWDFSTLKLVEKKSEKLEHNIDHVIFSPKGESFLTYGSFGSKSDNKVRVYDAKTLAEKFTITLGGWDNSVFYTSSGNFIATIRGYLRDKATVQLWNGSTGKLVSTYDPGVDLNSVSVSGNGEYMAVKINKEIVLLSGASGKQVRSFSSKKTITDWALSPNGSAVAIGSADSTVRIWSTLNGALVQTLKHGGSVYRTRYKPSGDVLLTQTYDDMVTLWDPTNGNRVKEFEIKGIYKRLDWANNLLYTHNKSALSIYDLTTGSYLLTWYAVDSADWIVKHSSGLFDASEGAMRKLYFMYGEDFIDFSQLKTRYYEPGLWKKIMNKELLRTVPGFDKVELPPDLQAGVHENGVSTIAVTNRKGGIGQISVSVNGLEVIEDIRPKTFDVNQPSWTYDLKLNELKNIKKGEDNLIELRSWNVGNWIVSVPLAIHYTPPASKGVDITVAKVAENAAPKIAIHILAIGTSDYSGDAIDLKYAAKDANSMAVTLKLGAEKLFGVEKAFVYTLTDSSAMKPSKENIVKSFKEISEKSSAHDVFVVYLSGHGINWGGDNGDFYYLTREAFATDLQAYKDPAIRNNSTISSNELVRLLTSVNSDKRVLIIDACASGKLVENLMEKKDIPSSTLKALDRLRDRTGFHIITGCASDAVSYEASRFGQGLLTYSLIEGIKGASLRSNQFVDVSKLFQYAADRVPVLAEGVGGIQKPQLFSPYGTQSFDIGELDDSLKSKVPLPKTRTVYVRSTFADEATLLEDPLDLGKKLDETLNSISSRGERSKILFFDVAKFADACKVAGKYQKQGDQISLTYRINCGGKWSEKSVSGKSADELVSVIVTSLEK